MGAQEDATCLQILGNDAVECSAFSMFWPYIESPFMVVSSEADPVVHFCADDPSLGTTVRAALGGSGEKGWPSWGSIWSPAIGRTSASSSETARSTSPWRCTRC